MIFITSIHLEVFAVESAQTFSNDLKDQILNQKTIIELNNLKKMSPMEQRQYIERSLETDFKNLSKNAKQNLIEFISEERTKEYVTIHKNYVDPNFKVNVPKIKLASTAVNPLEQISVGLKAMNIPLLSRYSLLLIAASLQASLTIPVTQIIGVMVSIGAAVVVLYYWDDISPVFDQIINLFKNALSSIVNTVTVAFNYIRFTILPFSLNLKNASMAKTVRKHFEQSCVESFRGLAPFRIYVSPPTYTYMAVFDVPKDSVCLANNYLKKDSSNDQKYDRKVKLTGYKMILIGGYDPGSNKVLLIKHAHLRYGGKIDKDIEWYRYAEKLTYQVIPLPVDYNEIYLSGNCPADKCLLYDESNKQIE